MSKVFDPAAYGAKPFDPASFGATPIDVPTADAAQIQSAPAPIEPDYLKGNFGYIRNPKKPGPVVPGAVTARDETGKVWTIPMDPKLPQQMAPGIIEGHIRSQTPAPSILDRLKSTPLDLIPGMGGQTVGNLMEGVKPELPSLRNVLRTAGAVGGGIIGGGAGAAGGSVIPGPGTAAGAIVGATAGGAAGASIGESAYQIGQHIMGSPDAPKEPLDAAKLQGGAIAQGALQEGGGAAVSQGLGKVSSMLQKRQVEQILAPSGQAMKADVEKISSALAGDMPVAVSRASLLPKVNAQVDTLGKAVDAEYAALRTTSHASNVNSAPVVDALKTARDAFMINGRAIPGLEPVVADYSKLIDGIGDNPMLSLDQFRQVKQGWDAAINWSRNAQARTPAMEQALTDGANAIRQTLHSISPSLEKADTAFSMWKTAQQSLKAKVTSDVGKPLGAGLATKSNVIAGTAGAAIGGLLGGPTGAAEGAGAAEAVSALMNTTAYRTSSLAVKKQVEDALAKKSYQKAIGLILGQTSGGFEAHVRGLTVPSQMKR